MKVRLERVSALSEGWAAPAKLLDGLASDFHIGFPQSGFVADTTGVELQNPAHGFLTFLGGWRGGVSSPEGPGPGHIQSVQSWWPGQHLT